MGQGRKFDLDHRLEAYFATLRSLPVTEVLKRSIGNWQMYAAVSGSAMAMATGISTSNIGSGVRSTRETVASVRVVRQHPASSKGPPFPDYAILAAVTRGQGPSSAARARSDVASQIKAPYIAPGGVVPIYGTTNIIQPGEWVSVYGQNLAGETATWNNNFPTSLGGTSVTIGGIPAYSRMSALARLICRSRITRRWARSPLSSPPRPVQPARARP